MISSVKKSVRNRGTNSNLFFYMVLFCFTSAFLTVFGLVMIFSSSYVEAVSNGQNAYMYFVKQFFFILAGVLCAILIVCVCSTNFLKGKVLFVSFVALMVCFGAVYFFGDNILGAKRWFYLGPFSMQPSEFMKIVVIVYTSNLICNLRYGNIDKINFLIKFAFYVLLPIVWILVFQKDMGTAIIIFIGCLICFWLSGVNKAVILGILALACIICIIVIVSSPHRLARVLALLYPDQYVEEGGYQLIRSHYAMAGGGVFGLGIGNSHEKFQYLPEAETDFIFAILVEETGIIGSCLVLCGFFIILVCGLYIAASTNDFFSKSIAASLTVMLVFQALMNIACVIGVLPVTGKPLPFFTQGGSSVIGTYCLCGIVLLVGIESLKNDKHSKLRHQARIIANRH